MRVYFLVEGRRTERKVYPAWLSHLIPSLKRIRAFDDNKDDSYFILSAEGYPSIYDYLVAAIEEVNTIGNYDYLVVCLDADEGSVEEKHQEIEQFLADRGARLTSGEVVVIVQNRCIETWFLGNRIIVRRNPHSRILRDYLSHYNIRIDDPELMAPHPDFHTHAQFHLRYLKEILNERSIRYSKRVPGPVLERTFLAELERRLKDEPTHLGSLRVLLGFLEGIANQVRP
jgi:hypothetical protein